MAELEKARIRRAAEILRRGGLVIFPTETVYGLGANALDPRAVAKIYELKGRPRTSPLIVHVASVEQARQLVTEWPPAAQALADAFWPGPLTLVLPKAPLVPDIVTAGLPTVAVRMPDHPVALALIREAGVPVAAPSANPFSRLSPTRTTHAGPLLAQVDDVLDAGATPLGIESTVVSLVTQPPTLLRPGAISRAQLESLIGPIQRASQPRGPHPSPGMHPKHYAPVTPLILVRDGELPQQGKGAYVWYSRPAAAARQVQMPASAAAYAARLYEVLHSLDQEGWDWIAVELPPETPEWEGVRDRLLRAAGLP